MRLSSFSIIVLFCGLAVVGLFFIPLLPVKLNPSRNMPTVYVSYSMSGQSARVIESEVTSKLEGMLSRVRGVEGISSRSGNGSGTITVRLNKHVDVEMLRFEISTVVRQAWSLLPQGVSYPRIYMAGIESNESTRPFMRYTINAPHSPIMIREYVENILRPKFADIKGIESIEVAGATQMIWKIEYDYELMKKYGITVNEIREAIGRNLGREFLGMAPVSNESKEWTGLSVVFESKDKFDPSTIQVSNESGTVIYLNQVATCSFEEEEATSYFRINGLNSIYMSFKAEQGANQLKLSEDIQVFLKTVDFPHGYELHLSYNEGDYIQRELNKIYFRSGLTLLILLSFVIIVYRNLRYSLLIFISLFVNISIAVIFYYLVGLEMQLYSLAGLTISLTLIIDNAIIMSDQIIRLGNKKAFMAVLAATTTTIGSLIIIFFLNESVRLNLQDFAWVIIINLSISLLIAILLVPALIEKFNVRSFRNSNRKFRILRFKRMYKLRGKRFLVYFNRVYVRSIRFVYRRRRWAIAGIILLFGLPVFILPDRIENDVIMPGGYRRAMPDSTFFGIAYNKTLGSTFYKEKIKPYSDVALGGTMRIFAQKVKSGSYRSGERSETTLQVTASLPNGATRRQMDELVQKMERYIGQYVEVRQFETSIQSGQRASIRIFFEPEHQRGGFPYLLQSNLISKAIELGGGSWSVYGLGDGFNNDVRESAGNNRIKLFGYNYDELMVLAEVIRDSLLQNRRINEVVINSEFSYYKTDYSEFVFDLNKERLAHRGITPYALYNSFTPMFYRKSYAGDHMGDNGNEPIYLFARQGNELDIWNMEHYPGVIGDFQYKLSDLATIGKYQAPLDIVKDNQQYQLCIQYEYVGSATLSNRILTSQINAFNDRAPLGYKAVDDRNYWSFWGGDNKSQYYLLFLIIAIVYATSTVLFNSLRQPFIIVFIIPISFIGVFLTFYLFDLNFDSGGFAAFVLLSGLSVNANIYVLNEYNNIRLARPGLSLLQGYIKAWNAKIKPIFLTVFSTVLGFIPFMVGPYRESFWFPLAAGTSGGLIFSLIALFFFLPLFMRVGKTRGEPSKNFVS